MHLTELTAVSPIDGRYRSKAAPLAAYFSEYALIRSRLHVEIEYLIALHETGIPPLRPLSGAQQQLLRSWHQSFGEADAAAVKALERRTNHDVKAIEYFLKERIAASGDPELADNQEFVHFGLTSQDINNTAQPLLLRGALRELYLPLAWEIHAELDRRAQAWRRIPMLARTHGQPATPTTLGKEMAVFASRLRQQLEELEHLPVPAKFGGASGNLNAHYAAYPQTDWHAFAEHFVRRILGLHRSYPTTQIEPYDGLARIFDCLRRINCILTDFCQDIWLYISMEYFRQQIREGETGSSAMPHKVNPIDFENAEGNCGLSTALLEFLSRKLPVSRLQRDLTDSTVLRNTGLAVGYAYLAQRSLLQGLGKLTVNEAALARDLDANWAVLAEAIQTILRREGYPQPYEALKALTRGQQGITRETLAAFIGGLEVPEPVRQELLALHPAAYLGDAAGFGESGSGAYL
ncbi:MAG: adenylosuccinate lyase [Bacteroidia bacterium]|nr:adenylosuccinate lyase [Bacteroidia bacterium]